MPTGTPTKMKHCAICGDLFLPAKPSTKICSKDHYVNCPVCGKLMVWNTQQQVQPCSKECRKALTKQRNLQKYGVDHPMKNKDVQAKFKSSMRDKYGVEHALQSKELKDKAIATFQDKFGTNWALSSPEIKQKSKRTMLERYGGETTFQSPSLRERAQQTCIERYGESNPMKSKDVKQKAINTCIEVYGVGNPMQDPDIIASAIKTRLENNGVYWTPEMVEKCRKTCMERFGVDNPSKSEEIQAKIRQVCLEKYGVPYGCLTDAGQAHINKISKTNIKFMERLNAVGVFGNYELYLQGKFFDIHIKDSNTVIEIDPTYTHNIIGNHWGEGLDCNYHLEKTKLAESQGFRCIHIFDWDDIDKVVSMLKPRQSIYARNCEIYRLNLDVAEDFLNEYHLQGSCRGQLLCLGLVKDGTLYQVMTFGKSRYDSKHDIELLRLCTLPGYSVTGGASKLFSYATSEYALNNIISYCDRSKFTGHVYEKIGMKLIRTTPPQEVWSKGNQKITANLLRQRGYDQLFKTNYGKGASNEMLMLENGWAPVTDCGQLVYEFKI